MKAEHGANNICFIHQCMYLKYLFLSLFLFTPISLLYATEGDFEIEVVELLKNDVPIKASVVLDEPVRYLVKTAKLLLAASRRAIWVSRDGFQFKKLDVFGKASSDADWISKVCAAGNQVLISIASYPEKRLQKELKTPKGGFRKGPQGRGMLFYNGDSVIYKKALDITKLSEKLAKQIEQYPAGDAGPPQLYDRAIQSCFYENGNLFLGSYGYLSKLNTKSLEIELIEMDLELTFNRNSILYENGKIWVSLDEGGASGGCIYVHEGDVEEKICLLNLNNYEVDTNTILVHKNNVYASSLAGLVSIDSDTKTFVHFQLSSNPREMRLFDASSVNDRIWGVRDDGFVSIDVENRKYTLYSLRDEKNVIYGLLNYKDNLYISNEEKLFRVERSELAK